MTKFTYLFVIISILSSVSIEGRDKSYGDYWTDLGIDYHQVEKQATTKDCYSSEVSFLGCAIGMAQIVKLVSRNGVLRTASQLKNLAVPQKVLGNFGAVSVIEEKSEKLGRAASLEKSRRERREMQTQWEELYADKKLQQVAFEELHQWIRSQPGFEKTENSLFSILLQAKLSIQYDPHTSMLPKAYVDEQSTGTVNHVGIGATMQLQPVDEKSLPMVQSPIENSPAFKAGLRAKDLLLKVNGESTEGKSLNEVVTQVRGPEGTTVRLTIQRKGKTFDVEITRAKIRIENVSAKIVETPEQKKIGVVKFRTFMSPDGCEKIGKVVRDLERERVDALALDLRGNGGGLLNQSVCIANLFLDSGKEVVIQRSTDGGRLLSTHKTDKSAQTRLPLFVLIDSGSASASEVLSGALQDHKRAWIVGERSFGKATVQSQKPSPDGNFYIRQTVARFYLPSGRTNQIQGITPDFEVYSTPNPTEDDKAQYREEDEYQALPPLGKLWTQTRPAEYRALKICQERQGKANSLYADQTDTGTFAPDYPVLYSADLLDCL